MAWRIVKQPNGLLARFSDIVDDFTHYNLTVKQAVKVCQDQSMGEAEAKQKVQNGVLDLKPWGTKPSEDGLSRWRDCLDTIKSVHGTKAMKKRVKECSTNLTPKRKKKK
jgi:hypothetical protein